MLLQNGKKKCLNWFQWASSSFILASFQLHLSIPTMDCRCSTIAFVALPAVMSLHLKLFELCKLVCSKVTKCQTQVETYPTGISSVALHLKFSFQKTSESTRQAKVKRMFMDVHGCSRSRVSGVPTTPRRNPVLLAQQYWQLQKSTRQRTQGGNKDSKPQSPYHDLVINLQLRNFWSCSPCRSGCANSSTLSWSLRLLATWHDLACHDSVATFQKESENYPKLNSSKELWIELTCNDMFSDDMYNDDMYKDHSWHLQ